MRSALNMVGLCARAGRLKSGLAACEQAVKKEGAALALVDAGASDLAKKSIADACAYKGVRLRALPEGALGAAIGRPGRMAAAVMDQGFADRITELIDQHRDCGGACRE